MFWLEFRELKLALLGNWQAGLKQGLSKTFQTCAGGLRHISGGEIDVHWGDRQREVPVGREFVYHYSPGKIKPFLLAMLQISGLSLASSQPMTTPVRTKHPNSRKR
ncbi:uncharacterized protein AKAW2_40301A [Aspergillus luchuensis]|uniref:Uncharacterized protein n=1 Tax=Aspergillus kawachii TaxID=1069201 RepID=A0A7R7W9Y2_ASPKA|nr:uncharacterized protein AKAW2_40301A [Aspergillus luchuensis]BCR98618.1 hypothetical protein AKAW2_40301A [Aspergillus luchuensis]